MGCISSKQAGKSPSAVDDHLEGGVRVKRSTSRRPVGLTNTATSGNGTHNVYGETKSMPVKRMTSKNEEGLGLKEDDENIIKNGKKLKGSKSKGSNSNFSLSLRFGSSKSQVVAEQTAAGWPAWLTAVAGEAIQGWTPLRADGFEKLDKIGQGTYSSVFKAREHATGRLVALKKVRFDNYHPESVRFMAREITILRKLDHPNIIKLHGLITSKVSCSIYLVFEYMEHDLSGLLSCPDIVFTEPQIKCFLQQIFYGLDYCHGKGVMHRDIKTSNILLNNDGILKLADFGLANFLNAKNKQPKPLTSRVVTLWYRPPELLLGSSNYGAYVDMWSAGCVFAELLIGKPILKGKTEVEQLHKIFKLSGSPPDEYWTKSKLPHLSRFKPQTPYESSLRERFKHFSEPIVTLLETLLSVDPGVRGTAASALTSEYFNSMPYACDPSSLPKYPPNKEIDAKSREDSRRRRNGKTQDNSSSSRMQRRSRKGLPEQTSVSMLGRPGQEGETQMDKKYARRNGSNALVTQVRKGDDEVSMDMKSDVSQVTNASQGDIMFGGKYNGKATALALQPKRRYANNDHATISSSSKNHNNISTNNNIDPSSVLCANNMLDSHPEEYEDVHGLHSGPRDNDSAKMRENNDMYVYDSATITCMPSDYHNSRVISLNGDEEIRQVG